MSDLVDLLIKSARDVKIAKASNPRAVQTVEQRQVEARQAPGVVQDERSRTSTTSATNLVSKIPGGMATVYVVGFGLLGTIFYKKVIA